MIKYTVPVLQLNDKQKMRTIKVEELVKTYKKELLHIIRTALLFNSLKDIKSYIDSHKLLSDPLYVVWILDNTDLKYESIKVNSY